MARDRIASGPRKEKSLPGPRKSTHKKRAGWFRARAAWPYRDADGAHLALERAAFETLPAGPQWEPMGPTNVGGRLTSVVVHPTNADAIWAGSAGGGVWRSRDGGASWTALWHKQESLNVGSLAIDPSAPDVLYCGTGEANLSADSYPGAGVFRSADGGDSWNLFAPAKTHRLPGRIGAIAVDPFDARHIRLGGVGHGGTDPSGMFTSVNGGTAWKRENFISANGYYCHGIVFHPARRGVIFATIFERGSRSGIWRSLDGGATWTHLTAGLPSSELFRRASLAIAASEPATVYAIASNDSERVLGVFVSRDLGDTWRSIGGTHFRKEGQMSYGITIAVHPTNAGHVLCGGVDLHRTTDYGATWKQATRWYEERGSERYAHADHHCLSMPAAAPGRVYDCNDGGMDRSDDGGTAWRNCSKGLAVTMYYDLDVAPSDAKSFGGGTQDNGTCITQDGKPGAFREILGGDGGWMVYHPQRATRLYASFYNFNIYRFQGSAEPKDVSPPASRAERDAIWMCYITIDPNRPKTVYTGSSRVWKTTNEGNLWKPVSEILDGSSITAIEVAAANSKYVYVGTENGGIFRSLNAGRSWSGNLAGSRLPGKLVSRIETDPRDASTVFVTAAGKGSSHVFRSRDAGLSWVDLDAGKLPDVPHSAIVLRDAHSLYVSNDTGVFASYDGGESWSSITRNLPNVMAVDLVYHAGEGTLWVATYGRGIWRLKVD